MLLKHVVRGVNDPSSAFEIREVGSNVSFGRAVFPAAKIEDTMDDLMVAIDVFADSLEFRGTSSPFEDPETGEQFVAVKWAKWGPAGNVHVLVTHGALFLLNPNGDTIEKV